MIDLANLPIASNASSRALARTYTQITMSHLIGIFQIELCNLSWCSNHSLTIQCTFDVCSLVAFVVWLFCHASLELLFCCCFSLILYRFFKVGMYFVVRKSPMDLHIATRNYQYRASYRRENFKDEVFRVYPAPTVCLEHFQVHFLRALSRMLMLIWDTNLERFRKTAH